jgi:signal transduction histidine kinase
MRELTIGRPRPWTALAGGLLLAALAIAQLPGRPLALPIAVGATGFIATLAQTVPAGFALLKRHRSLLVPAGLAVLLIAWVVVGLFDAARAWNPVAPFGLTNGPPFPASGFYWPPTDSWPWRINGVPLWAPVLALILGAGGFVLISDAVRVLVGLAHPPRSRWRSLSAVPTRGGRITVRAVPGVALIICGAVLAISVVDRVARDQPLTQLLGLLGICAGATLLIACPVVVGLSLRLDFDKEARARERERQRFAAHLHDSVLQTLALIQRQANEPEAVIKLASRQEDALRAWMAGQADLGSATVTSAVREMLTEVEDEHGVRAELTVIGDAKLDAPSEELIAAAREALRNVSRHAAGAPVNVFLDIGAGGTELFVRDSGPGFSFDQVPNERRGLRDSVIGRMSSVGGSATVDSTPGEGTEIALRLPPTAKSR